MSVLDFAFKIRCNLEGDKINKVIVIIDLLSLKGGFNCVGNFVDVKAYKLSVSFLNVKHGNILPSSCQAGF